MGQVRNPVTSFSLLGTAEEELFRNTERRICKKRRGGRKWIDGAPVVVGLAAPFGSVSRAALPTDWVRRATLLRFSLHIRGRDRRRRAFFSHSSSSSTTLSSRHPEGGGEREGSSNTKGLDLERGIGEGTREMNRWQ